MYPTVCRSPGISVLSNLAGKIYSPFSSTALAIAERRSCPQTAEVWDEVRKKLGAEAERMLRAGVVSVEPVDMSSTEIRERVRRGAGLRGCVRHPVAEYIRRWKLYSVGDV